MDAEIHLVTLAGFDGTKAPDPVSPFIQPAAESVVDCLEANGVQNVSLVGHSLGGVVAMLAALGMDRAERVLIEDSVPFLSALFFPGNTPEMARAYRPTLESQLELMDKEAWLQWAKSGLAVQAISEGGRDTVFEDVRAADLKASKAAYLNIMTTDYSEDFAKVSVPVAVLISFDPGAGLLRSAVLERYEAQLVVPGSLMTKPCREPGRGQFPEPAFCSTGHRW